MMIRVSAKPLPNILFRVVCNLLKFINCQGKLFFLLPEIVKNHIKRNNGFLFTAYANADIGLAGYRINTRFRSDSRQPLQNFIYGRIVDGQSRENCPPEAFCELFQ